MNDASGNSAIERIERALARIEAATARGRVERSAMQARHAALRDEVKAAVAAIDALIAEEDD